MRWQGIQSRGPIGLDVGDRWIKAVQLVGNRIAAVASVQREAAPAAPAAPAKPAASGGEQAAPPSSTVTPLSDAEVDRLSHVLSRRGFRGRSVVLSVPSRVALTSLLELPPRGSGAPLEQIARTELAHVHRREAAQMEVALWDLPKPLRAADGSHVMAVGCTHADADALLTPIERCFEPRALDTQGWALARACAPLLVEPTDIVAAVDLGWSAATLVLLYRQTVVYERSLSNVGLRGLCDVLRRTCSFNDDVIEYVLRDGGFRPADDVRRDDAQLLAKARPHLDAHFDALAQELRLSTSYAQHQYPQATVAQVALSGGGAGIPNLAEHLAGLIEAKVKRLAPSDVLTCSPSLAEEAGSPLLLLAAGLALHDGKGVACQAA